MYITISYIAQLQLSIPNFSVSLNGLHDQLFLPRWAKRFSYYTFPSSKLQNLKLLSVHSNVLVCDAGIGSSFPSSTVYTAHAFEVTINDLG